MPPESSLSESTNKLKNGHCMKTSLSGKIGLAKQESPKSGFTVLFNIALTNACPARELQLNLCEATIFSNGTSCLIREELFYYIMQRFFQPFCCAYDGA